MHLEDRRPLLGLLAARNLPMTRSTQTGGDISGENEVVLERRADCNDIQQQPTTHRLVIYQKIA